MIAKMLALAALMLTASAAPAPAPVERIAFKISSWGKPLSDWRIDAEGAAVLTYSEGPGLGSYRLITKKFDAGAQGFAAIRATLAKAEAALDDEPECGMRGTDLPYGTVRWIGGGKARELRFDTGCQGEAISAIHAVLRAADDQMRKWAERGETVEDREGHS